MKSKSYSFILIVVVLIVVGILLFIFLGKDKSAVPATPGLASTTTGTANTIPTAGGDEVSPGAQVVALLRNLSSIRLDDSVFRNPNFALLRDLSIELPPITNQGRRNPFAPVGNDAFTITTLPATETAPTNTGN